MAVEIYLEPELEEMVENEEATEEWKKKCEELGMEGQLSLVKKEGSEELVGKPSPYAYMTETMANVYAVLCPVVVNYKAYDKTTIPIEVLSHIALCEKEGYFNSIKIWYDDTEKDPLVVGYIKTGNFNETRHLIARFGAEVLPFEILKDRAAQRIQERVENVISELSVKSIVSEIFERGSSNKVFANPQKYEHKYS